MLFLKMLQHGLPDRTTGFILRGEIAHLTWTLIFIYVVNIVGRISKFCPLENLQVIALLCEAVK